MAKMLIKNLTATPLGLPPPFSGVLAGGGGTIIDLADFGGASVDDLASMLISVLGGPYVVSFTPTDDSAPVGPLTPQTSANLMGSAFENNASPFYFNGVALKDVANPTDAQDVATKDYVDSALGGQVDSVSSGNGISVDNTDPENPIVSISTSVLGEAAAGGSNAQGGPSELAGGTGDGTGAGGESAVRGGIGGSTDAAGGDAYVQGGAGGGTNGAGGGAWARGGVGQGTGTGGIVTVQGGSGGAAGAGGSVFVRGGGGGAGQPAGDLYLGDVFTESVTVGDTGKLVAVEGLLSATIASVQTISTTTPGTTDVVQPSELVVQLTVDVAEMGAVTLDGTTPIANASFVGQMLWVLHAVSSPQNIIIPSSSNVLAAFAGGPPTELVLAPGAVAQFIWSGSAWVQTSSVVVVAAS